jgi:hypothetical protein
MPSTHASAEPHSQLRLDAWETHISHISHMADGHHELAREQPPVSRIVRVVVLDLFMGRISCIYAWTGILSRSFTTVLCVISWTVTDEASIGRDVIESFNFTRRQKLFIMQESREINSLLMLERKHRDPDRQGSLATTWWGLESNVLPSYTLLAFAHSVT